MTNTTSKKMTKKDCFTALLAIEAIKNNAELTAFIKKELELLNKKSTKKAANPEHEIIKSEIMELLDDGEQLSISQMQEKSAKLAEYSNQKINSMLIRLKEEKKIDVMHEKRKAFFFKVK